jgi:alpha-L-rhamnosidase
MFGVMVGIEVCESGAGYSEITFSPHPDERIGFARASIETAHGKISGSWTYLDSGKVRYELTVPSGTLATVRIDGMQEGRVTGGSYTFIL